MSERSYIVVPPKGSLPTAEVAFKDQIFLVRGSGGTPDKLYLCRYNGSAYENIELTAHIVVVQEGGVETDATVTTLNFDASDFNLTESPEDTVTVALNYGTAADTPAAGNHTHAATGITVNEGGVLVDATVTTLDFDASDFNLTESPEDTVSVALAYGTGAGTPAEGNHAHAGTYQPLDGELTSLAALESNGLVTRTANDTITNRSIAVGSAKLTVSNADGAAGNPTLDVGSVAIDDLSDVTITAAASGDFLRHSGVAWVDSTIQAGDIPTGVDATKIADGSVTSTEFQYIGTLTSNAQTQLDGKVADTGDTMTGSLKITSTGTAALEVEDGSNVNVVIVDTTNKEAEFRNGTKLIAYSDDGTTTKFAVDGSNGNAHVYGALTLDGSSTIGDGDTDAMTLHGLFLVAGTDPSISAGANLGSTGTATVNWGTDTCFQCTLVTGGAGIAAGTLATVTFVTARAGTNYRVTLDVHSTAAADANLYTTSRNTTTFAIASRNAPSGTLTIGVGVMGEH